MMEPTPRGATLRAMLAGRLRGMLVAIADAPALPVVERDGREPAGTGLRDADLAAGELGHENPGFAATRGRWGRVIAVVSLAGRRRRSFAVAPPDQKRAGRDRRRWGRVDLGGFEPPTSTMRM